MFFENAFAFCRWSILMSGDFFPVESQFRNHSAHVVEVTVVVQQRDVVLNSRLRNQKVDRPLSLEVPLGGYVRLCPREPVSRSNRPVGRFLGCLVPGGSRSGRKCQQGSKFDSHRLIVIPVSKLNLSPEFTDILHPPGSHEIPKGGFNQFFHRRKIGHRIPCHQSSQSGTFHRVGIPSLRPV